MVYNSLQKRGERTVKKSYLVLAFAAIGAIGCEKIISLADISKDFTYTNTVDVPKVEGLPPVIGPLPGGGMAGSYPTMAFATNSEQYTSENGSALNLVKEVKMKQLSVAVLQPEGRNFDFLDTVRVYISGPGMSEQLVAYKYGVPKGMNKLDLDVEPINLKEYFIKDSMYVRFGGHFNAVPATESKLEITSVYNMLANPLQKSE